VEEAEMPVRIRSSHLDLKDLRNYGRYLSGILVEVLTVFLLMGIGLLIVWAIPKLIP
jgi:hypothetical protein